MGAVLKILSPGVFSSLQDRGRLGFGAYGVPRSGAADPVSLRIGNHLLGNDAFETAIEFRFLGPKILIERGSVRLALAGDATADLFLSENDEAVKISPWQTVRLDEGDILSVMPLSKGATGYLALEGGFDLEPVLGSCSTYARAGLGGVNGKNLQQGDCLTARLDHPREMIEKIVKHPPRFGEEPLRVLLGPQDDYFSVETLGIFEASEYQISSDVDRMGIRLEGTALAPLPEKGSDLISDGLVPGAIQIPGNGQPIVLFVDCQTIGGYPKIATVITADLHHLGQVTPGNTIRFKVVTPEEARAALDEREQLIQQVENSVAEHFGEGFLDLKALYQSNLIAGVVNAKNSGHFPGHLEEGSHETD
ncbi:biotin-dependent carboxyltransferase family protein [Kiloniella laminariae]|uniref:Biotin-dependent carboxyltransferase family protein n=1 Tax=Kiloniella laminariae TaxID=454162 RepID=A0ABT4LMY5_9PROT|nr:biotin-dependent carboxyltransferase family protein [Kiloniella laminariae]MCZ4282474.1 biotin-dependent carboxyltransferase family protein [Kiloniella laminariae]